MTYNCCICRKSNPDPPFKSLNKLPVCSDSCHDKLNRNLCKFRLLGFGSLGASMAWFFANVGEAMGATLVGACTLAYIVSTLEKLRNPTTATQEDDLPPES
jgi:hypothetical protein